MIKKQENDNMNLPSASFEDFFIVDDILKKPENIANITNLQINKNPQISLNKLLAYSLYYSEHSRWFDTKKMDMSLFKNQIGKDVGRTDIIINNEKYNANYEDSNHLKTDKYNINLMNILSKFSIIDLDLINKIGIITCQNIFNFISDLITILISSKLTPETAQITQAKKNILITLNKNEQFVIFNFNTKFWITKNKSIVDPEFTCGNMKYVFLIDFKKNTYKISQFDLKYDSNICYQSDNTPEQSDNAPTQNNKKESHLLSIGLPLGLTSIATLATPFVLATLGGKTKKLKRKKGKRKNNTKKGKRK